MGNTPSRRERDQARHREEILAAAKAVFVTRGFEGATMQEIAASAEFPLASVYKYFGSKENLFQELMAKHVRRYLEEVEAAKARVASPLEKIKISIRVSISHLQQERALTHLLLRELRGLWAPRDATQTANQAYRAVYFYYETLFREAGAAGELTDVDPSAAALCLIGSLYLTLVYSVFIDPSKRPDADEILRVVLGPIEASPPAAPGRTGSRSSTARRAG